MSLTYAQSSEIVRGRLNLPTSAKLRIQKAVPSALQVFSERIAMDENKRSMILTPRTVTGTPTNGILDLAALVTSNRLMIDKLHLGYIYNAETATFASGDVDTVAWTITILNNPFTDGLRIKFSTSGSLPSGLVAGTYYYVVIDDPDLGSFQVYSDQDDPTTIVPITTGGSGTHTITVVPAGDTPLSMLSNPQFTSFPVAWMNSALDKFWWLIGNNLYAFKGDGQPITTALQFVVPHTLALTEFATSPLQEIQDEYLDVLTELVSQGAAQRDNPE